MSDDIGRQTAPLEEVTSKRAILIYNERTKLSANALDRASTAVLSVGIIAPVASYIYGVGVNVRIDLLFAWFVIWVAGAILLHWTARRILGGMTYV
jgi:hypothetical protein